MVRVVCTDPAYERLKDNGILKKISDKRRPIESAILYGNPYDANLGEDFPLKIETEVRGSKRLGEGVRDLYSDLLRTFWNFDNSNDRPSERAYFFIENSSFLPYLVLGKDVLKFRKLGFPS